MKWRKGVVVFWFVLLLLTFAVFGANYWKVEVYYRPSEPSPWSVESSLTWEADLGGIALVVNPVISTDGIERLTFTGAFSVDIWDFYSELSFSPLTTGGFDHLLLKTSFTLPGLTTELKSYLSYTPTATYRDISFHSTIGTIKLDVTNRFTGQDIHYDSTTISASMRQVGCIGEVSLSLSFAKVGFQELKIAAKGVPLLGTEKIPFDIKTTFTVAHKDVNIMVQSDLPLKPNPCLTVYVGLSGNPSLPGFSLTQAILNGFELKCAFKPFQFRSVTALNPAYAPTLLDVYKEGYWEEVELSLSEPLGCCGQTVDWGTQAYFSKTGGGLFEWVEIILTLEIKSQEGPSVGFKLDITDRGLEELGAWIKLAW